MSIQNYYKYKWWEQALLNKAITYRVDHHAVVKHKEFIIAYWYGKDAYKF